MFSVQTQCQVVISVLMIVYNCHIQTSVHYLQAPEILEATDNGHGYWAENVLRNVPVLVQ